MNANWKRRSPTSKTKKTSRRQTNSKPKYTLTSPNSTRQTTLNLLKMKTVKTKTTCMIKLDAN